MQNKIQYTSCPLCEDEHITFQFDIKDYSISQESFQLWDCQKCGFRFTQNVPDQKHAGPYYESEDYVSHSDSDEGFINRIYHIARSFMLSSKKKLIAKHTTGKSLLDIGSGTGYFPNIMKEAGYDVTGIEINEEARKYSKEKFGLSVFAPQKLEAKEIAKKFDFITMWHVMEHIYDIHGYMSLIKDHLEQNGHLVLALPNYKSYDATHYGHRWAGYDVPRHLWHFVPNDIRFLAEKYNFDIVQKKKMPLDSFYVSLLSEKHKGASLALLKGFFYGLISFLKALFNVDKCSSIIYVLKSKD